MKVLVWVMVVLSACSYWRSRPRADVAPSVWAARSGEMAGPGVEVDTRSVAASSASVEERLQNLERLHRDGLITDGEYRERRRRALSDAFE